MYLKPLTYISMDNWNKLDKRKQQIVLENFELVHDTTYNFSMWIGEDQEKVDASQGRLESNFMSINGIN